MDFTIKALTERTLALPIFLPAIYIFTLMWWIPEGAKYVPGAVVVALVASLIKQRVFQPETIAPWKSRRAVTLSLWLFTFYGAFVYFLNGDSWTELRAILAMAIYLTIIPSLFNRKKWLYTILIISALGFIIQSWTLFALGEHRIGGFINPIPYATGLATILLTAFIFGLFEERKVLKYFLLSITVLLFTALLLTQTRGVILPVAIALPMLLIIYTIKLGKPFQTATIFLIGLGLIGASVANLSSKRLDRTYKEISILESGNYSTSIGLRLVMWDAGISIWKEAPFFGAGDTHNEVLDRLLKEKMVNPTLRNYNPPHYHNQYVDLLAKKGIIGLSLFLLLIFSLIMYILQKKEQPTKWACLSIVYLVLFAGLTDVPFRHPDTIYLFFILILTLSTENPLNYRAQS